MSKAVDRSLMSPVLRLSNDGEWLNTSALEAACTGWLWDIFRQPRNVRRYWLELSEKSRGLEYSVLIDVRTAPDFPRWWQWHPQDSDWYFSLASAACTLLNKCPHADRWRKGVKLWLTLWFEE